MSPVHRRRMHEKKVYDQVSVNVYNFGTNSEKNISNQKSIIINGTMVLGGAKPIGLINFGKIFTIILENFP